MSHQPKVYYPRKRRRDEENEKGLNQQTNKAMSETEPITYQTKLTDVNNDCLETIFMYLSLDDLLNIAHTNTQLKPAADMIFARNYGKIPFHIYVRTIHRFGLLRTNEYYIEINDLKTALRLLRCYGHLVLNLTIENCTRSSFRTALIEVLRYINQYCFETLEKISFDAIYKYMFETSMEKPLVNNKTVKFNRCVLGKKMSKLNNWFPAMRCLTLNGSRFTDPSSIEAHFPYLEQLDFFNVVSNNYFTPETVMAVFRLNPQLRRISLDRLQSSELLRSASQYLLLLDRLIVIGYSGCFCTGETIHFQSVKKLSIRLFCLYNQELSYINLSFDQLEEVEMYFGACHGIDVVVGFLTKHQSINKLKFCASYSNSKDLNKENMIRIVTALPLLNDLDYSGIDFSVEEIIQFLAEFKSLNRFCFSTSESMSFDRLRTQLGDEWGASINGYKRVQLERK